MDQKGEIEVYKTHNNDVNDIRYQEFVSPISNYVLNNFMPHHEGLDFGSGTGPVISKILQDNLFRIEQFDPFFSNKPELLERTYDYIVSCEVMEHFHSPDKEFALLNKMLQPNGALVCMTLLYDDEVEFQNWFYKKDPTHVFFYRKETIKYIAEKYQFNRYSISGRLIVFNN